jgi:hypothetical protein
VPILATTAAATVATLNHELNYLEHLQDHEKDIIDSVARARNDEVAKLRKQEHYDPHTGARIRSWNDDFHRKQHALYHAWDRIEGEEAKHQHHSHSHDVLLHTQRSEASWPGSVGTTVPTVPVPAKPVPVGSIVRTVVHAPHRADSRAPSPDAQSRSTWDWLGELGQGGQTSVPTSNISVAQTGGTGATVTPGKFRYPPSPRQSVIG